MMILYGESALELYRSYRRLLPTLLDKPRTAILPPTEILRQPLLDETMSKLGIASKPYHLMAGTTKNARTSSDLRLHRRRKPLPPRALIKISKEVWCPAPEIAFLQICAQDGRDMTDLVQLGYELCGTYLMDTSWDGYTPTNSPLTTKPRINRLLEQEKGSDGIRLARQVLSCVLDGSHSPMETVMAMLFTCPRRLGGMGLAGARMNYRVATASGPRFVDLAFPDLGIGLEYKGRAYHAIEQTQRDDRRRNTLAGSGFAIIDVWYEDLAQDNLFQQLVVDVYRAAGVRLRIRGERFAARQQVLRARLLPTLKDLECG